MGDEHVAPEPAAVVGEAVQVDAVLPSREDLRARASTALSRTGAQVGTPLPIVVTAVWLAALIVGPDLDLDPWGPGKDLPQNVSLALGGIITWVTCYLMNRRNLRGGDKS